MRGESANPSFLERYLIDMKWDITGHRGDLKRHVHSALVPLTAIAGHIVISADDYQLENAQSLASNPAHCTP